MSASGDGGLGAGGLDAAGFSWMSWDMIQKVRRADQGFRGITDASGQNAVSVMGNEGPADGRE